MPQFNIRSSNAADYMRNDVAYDVLFMFLCVIVHVCAALQTNMVNGEVCLFVSRM